MTPEEVQKKVEELQARHQRASARKAGRMGELKAKKEELAGLIEEIRAAGYDPKTLKQAKEEKQKELEAMIATFERDLVAIETALDAYEG